jgi:hypothetical protein
MMRAAFALGLAAALPAGAADPRPVEERTGTEGLTPVTLTIRNAAGERIACIAQVAHWYSLDVLLVQAESEATATFWLDPKTGTYASLNARGEPLPVERLWCGIEGALWETSAIVALDRGAERGAIALTCAEGAERLRCRERAPAVTPLPPGCDGSRQACAPGTAAAR